MGVEISRRAIPPAPVSLLGYLYNIARDRLLSRLKPCSGVSPFFWPFRGRPCQGKASGTLGMCGDYGVLTRKAEKMGKLLRLHSLANPQP
jgi:hypothetical protein